MKIGFAQINPTVGNLRGNCELIIGAYERLAAAGAELVLTPELAITGYPPQDLVFKSRFVPENLALLEKLHSCMGEAALLVGFVDRNEGRGNLLLQCRRRQRSTCVRWQFHRRESGGQVDRTAGRISRRRESRPYRIDFRNRFPRRQDGGGPFRRPFAGGSRLFPQM